MRLWLRNWLARQATVARVQIERDGLAVRCIELADKAQAYEARYYAELDANRRREDSLVANVVELAGGKRLMPTHTPALPPRPEEGDVPADARAEKSQAFYEAVETRAKEFEKQAKFEYGSEDREMLRDKIKAAPEEYEIYID
jgi:hypothetical protein